MAARFYEQADARTEISIPEGRLDVLVSSGNRILAIENKPWASDQSNQISRYFHHLDNRGISEFDFVYLTVEGSAPSFDSIDEEAQSKRISDGQLHFWAYRKEILAWLSRCRTECHADRVSVFIDEFSRYIRNAFEGVKDKTMSDHLIDEISGSADNVSAAMQIILLAESIRKKLLYDLRQQIVSKAFCEIVELKDNPWQRWSGLTIRFSQESPYAFCMEFQNTQYNGLFIGVPRREKDSPEIANEYGMLVKNIGHAPQNPYWLWGRYASMTDPMLPVARDWAASVDPWIDIANGKLACRIVEAFTRIHAALDECGVG